MSWTDHALWWHVYPLGFCGAPIRETATPAPRLRRLFGWLDYAVELGASGLLLGPVFASSSHGYDTLDHFAIDPRLGSEDDLADLVAACKARGLRVVLDGVFSHVGREHPLLGRALAGDPDAAALFDLDWEAPGGPRPRVFEGHGDLVRLNHSSNHTVGYVGNVLNHWLDRGIDGWRLDAAYSVNPDFWARVLPGVRERHPEAWILGEVIHGDYAGFVEQSGVDSVTEYELWKAIWSSLNDVNFFELDWTLRRHNALLERFVPQTFVGNHDVTRIASRVGPERALLALAVLLTVGGVPSVYAGDEQGFTGIKEERFGGDDAIRPAFPERPDQLAGWGRGILRAHQDLIGLRRRHPWLVTATTETVELTQARYSYRSRSRDGSRWIQVTLDLAAAPSATITSDTGETLWQHRATLAA